MIPYAATAAFDTSYTSAAMTLTGNIFLLHHRQWAVWGTGVRMVKRFLCGLALLFTTTLAAQTLAVTYGTKGVQALSFGATLEDVGTYSSDAYHIWHMRVTDTGGNVISNQSYGETAQTGESWNSGTHTETYTFSWGSVATQFVQSGNTLNMVVTEVNNAGSGVILQGAEIYPFALHFPSDPSGFSGYSQYGITTIGPGVIPADFGTGIVTSVAPDESQPLYNGWKQVSTNTYVPLMTTTAPDGLPAFLPSINRPVPAGTTYTYTVSLRFAPEGSPASAADAYSSFAATYPSQMTWTDKRIIGTAYLASSPTGGDVTQPGGFPTNPRRWFNDSTVDITTTSGQTAFQNRVLAAAAASVTNAQALNAQGVITWDLEGEEYPQATTYVGSPDQIATVAPEMEATVLNTSSPFYGQKLDDAYFKTFTNAGFRVGLTLRPQQFTLSNGTNSTATQVYLSTNAAIISNLETKARFANTRWGVTLFYVDSTVDVNGETLDPAIFQQLITDLPTFLFIPEESTPRYYAYTAPFYSFIFLGVTGTNPGVYNYYPNAFGAILVNDVAANTLAASQAAITASAAHGDVLMGHADYAQANNPTLVSIYNAAHPVVNALTGLLGNVTFGGNLTFNLPGAPVSLAGTLAGISLGANASLNGFKPFPGSSIYTDISAYPVSSHNADFQCYWGSSATSGCQSLNYGLKFDFSGTQYEPIPGGIPYNVIDPAAHPSTTPSRGVFDGITASDPTATPAFSTITQSDDIPLSIYSGLAQENGVDPSTSWTWHYSDGTSAAPGATDQHLIEAFTDGRLAECYQCKQINGVEYSYNVALWDMTKSIEQNQHMIGRTSADAAGLPIFPLLIRPEEVLGTGTSSAPTGGGITHRMRMTLSGLSALYGSKGCVDGIAIHQVGGHGTGNPTACMGSTFRLKASYSLAGKSPVCTKLLQGLKTYGVGISDLGTTGFISGVGDARYSDDDLLACGGANLHMSDLEMVDLGAPLFTTDSNDTATSSAAVKCTSSSACTTGTPPTINAFTASATTAPLGTAITLTASATNAAQMWTDCAGRLVNGSLSFTPTQNVSCTLFAEGLNGISSSGPINITLTGSTVATPTFSPAAGSYGSAQTVTLADATSGAAIHYTLDGSTPGCYSPTYSGPITVNITSTVSSIACASGYLNSAVSSAAYTISGSPAQLQSTYNNNNNGNGGTTLTVTATNSTGGNLNIVAVNLQGSATAIPTSVTSSGGATGTLIKAQNDGAGGGNGPRGFAVYSFPNAPSGTVTYTATWAASTSYAGMTAFVWSGAAITSPIESAVGNSGNSGSITCGTVTTTGSNEIIQAIGEVPYGNASSPGYTPISNVTNFQSSYLTVPSATSTVVTQTESTGDFQVCEAFGIRHQ